MKYFSIFFFAFLLPIFSVAQPFGNSIYLDGTSNYVEIADSPSINVSDSLTLEAWIKPCVVSGHTMIMSKLWCSGGQNSYYFSIKNGKLRWVWFHGACGSIGSIYESNLPVITTNTWQHVTMVHTPTSVTLYLNGVAIQSTLVQGYYSSLRSSNQPIRIGTYRSLNSGYQLFFKGEMDEVRIWDESLSATTILARYNSELLGNESGLVSYFNMNNTSVGPNKSIPNNAINSIVVATTKGSSSYITPFFKNTNRSFMLNGDSLICNSSVYTLSAAMPVSTYLWGNGSTSSTFQVTNAGTYNVSTTNGCGVFRDTVTLSFDSIPTVDLGADTTLCQVQGFVLNASFPGANYQWNDGVIIPIHVINVSGNYAVTVTNGCGSVYDDITVTYNNSDSTITETSCGSYTSPSGNNIWSVSGTYQDTLVNSMGCDSLLTVNLTVNQNTVTTISPTSCGSYNSPSGNYIWITTGTYYDTIPIGNGCDNLFTVNLTVNSASSSTNLVTTCDSYTSPSGNSVWTSSGTYYDTIPNAAGCDSLMTFNLTINQSTSSTISPVVCASYTSPSGNTVWTNSGTYTDVIPNSIGCDSTITINLAVNNSFATISPTACNSYTSPSGKLWTVSGVYQDTIVNSVGCDSIISINLTLGTNSLTTENVSSCSSYIWSVNGLMYLNSGTHSETLTSVLGCDSVVVLNLTILQSSSSIISVAACSSYVSPSGTNTWTGSGVYTDVIPNNAGCDSTITINLTINNSSNSLQTVASCGTYLWSVNGTTYQVGGVYVATIPNSVGCDSVITLNLTINSATSSMVNITNCGSYTWTQNGTTYNASGQYMDTITNSVGCDSIITLNLTINNSSTGSESVSACGSYTSPSGNYIWTVSGAYTDTIPNSVGCDSIITTNLTINSATSSSQTATACDSYFWASNSQTYTSSGTYMDTTLNYVGCDSIITLNLTINNSYTSTVPQSACDTYTWPLTGVTYTVSGNYSDTMIAVTGCDSIITLNLQINTGDSTTENVTSCGSYLWSTTGNLYSTSGNFQALLANSNGCDSLVTLSLVIATPSTDTIPMTACDSYQWLLNGNTYTMSGFYTDSLTSVSGCDSLIILDLRVNNSSTGTLTENSCGAYTAPDGSLYTTSGQYTAIIPNSTGCDSVITVNLTVTNIDTTVTQSGFELTAAATGFNYQWVDCDNGMNPISGATNITYVPTVNGSYAVEITDGVCLETSSCHKVTGVGVNEIRLTGISVYPNPVFDELKVLNEQGLPLEIIVLDLTGRQIRTKQIRAELTTIDFTNLPSGVYLIQIKSDSQVMIEKVTVR